MHEYMEFFTALNPVVLGILLLVLACGAYDHWMQPK
jgi:hypothetical protein